MQESSWNASYLRLAASKWLLQKKRKKEEKGKKENLCTELQDRGRGWVRATQISTQTDKYTNKVMKPTYIYLGHEYLKDRVE